MKKSVMWPSNLAREYVDLLIVLTERFFAETKEHLAQKKKSGDLYDYLGSLGGMKVTEARLDWLRVVHKQITRKRG